MYKKIKLLNIKIKEILYFYYYLINNKDEEFEIDIKDNKCQCSVNRCDESDFPHDDSHRKKNRRRKKDSDEDDSSDE